MIKRILARYLKIYMIKIIYYFVQSFFIYFFFFIGRLFGIKITEILNYILFSYKDINNNYTGTLTAVISEMSNYHWKLDRISIN